MGGEDGLRSREPPPEEQAKHHVGPFTCALPLRHKIYTQIHTVQAEIDQASDYGLISFHLKQRYRLLWVPLVAVLPATEGYLNQQQQKG